MLLPGIIYILQFASSNMEVFLLQVKHATDCDGLCQQVLEANIVKQWLWEKLVQMGEDLESMVSCCSIEIFYRFFDCRFSWQGAQTTSCSVRIAVIILRPERVMQLGFLSSKSIPAPCDIPFWAVWNAMLFGMAVMQKIQSLLSAIHRRSATRLQQLWRVLLLFLAFPCCENELFSQISSFANWKWTHCVQFPASLCR